MFLKSSPELCLKHHQHNTSQCVLLCNFFFLISIEKVFVQYPVASNCIIQSQTRLCVPNLPEDAVGTQMDACLCLE